MLAYLQQMIMKWRLAALLDNYITKLSQKYTPETCSMPNIHLIFYSLILCQGTLTYAFPLYFRQKFEEN